MRELKIKDRKIFDRFLNLGHHELSAYSFENIYIWKGLFNIRWEIIRDHLCVFFKDKVSCFMYLSCLAKIKSPEVVEEAFVIMDKFNKNKTLSRIENVETAELSFFQGLGYECVAKPPEYLCLRQDLVQLKGDAFKSKRSACNYFIKHYSFKYSRFSEFDQKNVLTLYRYWMNSRKQNNSDNIYRGMLKDSLSALKIFLKDYRSLKGIGRVVKINDKIKAFTFGFKLNQQTFCILYEVTDLTVKGLAQFIFRKFCSELKNFTYINIMDDSGLENLKRLKLSYHPAKLIPAFIIQRKR